MTAWVLLAGCSAERQVEPWPVDLPDNPEDGAHFDGAADPFYEGWYHKVAIPDSDEAFFFIYSVVNPKTNSEYPSEAFLYCGRQSSLDAVYRSYPAEDYRAAQGHRDVRIAEDGRATALRLAGDLADAEHACSWDIALAQPLAWRNTMGWLTGVEGLETSWTVGTLAARASGWVEFDGARIEFEDQQAYGDHNWGMVFPRQWIWLQANDFARSGLAVAASGGTVTLGQSEIEALMIGLRLNDQMITFRTQDMDRVDVNAERGRWQIKGERDLDRVTIQADCDAGHMFHLLAPTGEGMRPRAWESLQGRVRVVFERRASPTDPWRSVVDDVSNWAGVEWGG